MGISQVLAKSATKVVRLQVGSGDIWFDYEVVPIDRAVVLTAQKTTAFALYEITKSMGSTGTPVQKMPSSEELAEMDEKELEQALGNMMHVWRQVDPGTIKEGTEQMASIVSLGVRRGRAWTSEAHLVTRGAGTEEDPHVRAPRVGPDDEDPEVLFEALEITTQERLQDPDHGVVWVNALPPSHVKPLHDAIFSMSSEDAARIARFR